MSTIMPADFYVEEEDKAKSQARAQYASISRMVAAMGCDYDRLEELRDMAKTPRYVAGWNRPGYMPDNPPSEFDDVDDARNYVADEMERHKGESGDFGNERNIEVSDAAVDECRNGEGEYGATFGNYHYFVTRDGFMPLSEDEAEEFKELEEAAGEYEDQDAARDAIREDPLSVAVRSGWETPGAELKAAEFQILLCTGGPAVRIMGELNEYGEPCRAWLEYQDWGTPWTHYMRASQATLLDYARCFYFGEG